ncbi:MAG: NAD-dependent epimerase/dehydratase family protein [Planctomycetota bacterium]
MKILVTGGAGFIGSHIVDKLVKDGAQVRVLDNFSAGRMDNLRHNLKKIDLLRGNIRHIPTVKRAVQGVKYIIHEAALKSVPESLKRPEEFNAVNVTGTLNLLIQASKAGVKRVVFASSSSIYGDVKELPQKESLIPAPISPYGATKVIGETYLKTFNRLSAVPTAQAGMHHLETVCLRYFNVFGPRQEPSSPYAGVIIKFINAMLKNKRPVIFGDGRQSRDFTYVDNVVKATIGALTAKGVDGLSLNIASSHPITVLGLVQSLNKILDKNLKPIIAPIRTGDIKHSYADITLARKYLGYKTIVPFEQGLIKTIQFCENK